MANLQLGISLLDHGLLREIVCSRTTIAQSPLLELQVQQKWSPWMATETLGHKGQILATTIVYYKRTFRH